MLIIFLLFTTLSNPLYAATIISNTATANFSINNTPQQLSDTVQFTKDTVVIPVDELTLEKEVINSNVILGEQATYTLTITNPNNNILENLTIKDILPTGLSYTAGTAKLNNITILNGQISYTGNQLDITLGDIPANTVWTVSYQALTNIEGTLINQATAITDTATSPTAQASINVTQQPIAVINPLIISKQANKQSARVGEVIVYNIVINNPNNSTIINSILSDVLPTNLSYISGSALLNNVPVSANTTNGLILILGDIPANANWIISYQAKIISNGNSGLLINKALVTANDSSANSNIANASIQIIVDPIIVNPTPVINPLIITKKADKLSVKLGDTIAYNITINNPNNSTISNGVLNDVLPTGLSYVESSALLNNIPITANTSDGLKFQLGNIPANAEWNLSYETKLDSSNSTSLINKAFIITNNSNANSNIANSSIEVIEEPIVIEEPDELLLTKSADKIQVNIGETVKYTLEVNNPEDHSLSDIKIVDILPEGFNYVPETATKNGTKLQSSKVQNNSQELKLLLDSIAPNQTYTVSYEVTVTDNAKLGNAKNIAVAESGTIQSLTASASIIVKEKINPLILTIKADKSEIKLGDLITYSLTIKNPNNILINNGSLLDTLPEGLEYISGTALLNNTPITTNSANDLSFSLGDIPANAEWLLTYQTKLESGRNLESLVNTASIKTAQESANSNISSSTVTIRDDKLTINKSVNKSQVVTGDIVLYTIDITNPEDHDQLNIHIHDTLPNGFIYREQTAKINNDSLSATDVQVTDQELLFNLSTLKKNQTISLTYEVEVSNNAIPGSAKNIAYATSDFAKSSTASATLKVRTPSTIKFFKINDSGVEAVIPPTSFSSGKSGGKSFQEINKITLPNGVVINLPSSQQILEAEEYNLLDPVVIEVTDLDQNLNSEEVDTIIVTIEVPGTDDKEVLLLTEISINSGIFRGVIVSTANSSNDNKQNGFLSLKEGSEIRVIYRDEEDLTDTSAKAALVNPEAKLLLTKTADKDTASIGEQIRYTLTFQNTTPFQIPNLLIKDTLPLGFKIIVDSIRLNGESLDSNQTSLFDGRAISFQLGSMASGRQWTLEYLTKISAGVQMGDSVNTAQIESESLKSNIAKATVKITDDLMRTHNILTGRVYIGCGKNDKQHQVLSDARIYLETGRSILSDEEGFWHMEGVLPGSHVLQLDEDSLPEGYEPLLCDNNTRHAGDAKSQFIDLQAGSLWQVDFYVKENKQHINNKHSHQEKPTKAVSPFKLFDKNYLETAKKEFKILWPKNNSVPTVASTKIMIQSSFEHRVEVLLNGKKVNPLNYDGNVTNKNKTLTIRKWVGVDIDIKRRNNTILAILKDKSGKEVARKSHNLHFSGEANSVEFLPEKSILIADGKTKPLIALSIKDEDGYPLRPNSQGTFSFVGEHYQVKTTLANQNKLDLNGHTSGSKKYKVDENGLAYIELNPTTKSGEVKLKFKLKNSEKIISAWLTPNLRKWILVGIAEGTVAHKKLSGNIQALSDLDKADRSYKRGRVAFFAKGKIKGKYLLTLAYDTHKKSHRNSSSSNSSLETPINTIDPDAWYTIYADNSHSQNETPSSEKLYVRIEKDNFYTVFGDFQTGLSVTELTKYERILTGIKSEYHGERLEYNAFISETANKHHHQEIPGDGTSGLYYLNNDIIINSEKIRLETRDRFHPEVIIESQELTRYQDYEIDYDAGTLFFKFPINGRDNNFNPNIIVVDYDSETDSEKTIIAGGRVALKTKNEKLKIGLSTIQIGRNESKDDLLVGIDASYQLTPDTKISAEIAKSKSLQSEFNFRAAQILELEKRIDKMEAKLYYRKQEKNYGLGSEGSVSTIGTGTKKIGAEIRYKINDKTNIDGEVSQQDNLADNNQRQLAQINLTHQFKKLDTDIGIRHSKEILDDKHINSNTLLLGGKYTTENGKVSIRSNIEKGFNEDNGSELNPDRLTVGVDVKLKEGISLFAEHEVTNNGDVKTRNNRVGVNTSLWEGAKAKTTYTQETTYESQRNYATLGLSQKIKLTEKIQADISVDHSKTLSGVQKRFNEDEPNIDGPLRDDYTAFSVGLGSNDEKYSWTSRFELRNGDIEDKINFTAGLIRHLKKGKQVSGKLSFYDSDNAKGESKKVSKLSFGSAWHPKGKDFVLFNRLDLIDDKINTKSNQTSDSHTQKVIHNIHFNRKINNKTQIGLHHGVKHVIDSNNQSKHSATIDTGNIEVRRDISSKVDIGIRAGYLRDWSEKTTEAVAGVSVGVTPMKNAWFELGYNFEGFDDEDFDKSNYKRKGPYASFRYKFNQDSFDGKDLPIRRKSKDKDETTQKIL